MRWNFENMPPLRWLAVLAPLVVAFFYIPLAFGGTTPESVRVLDWILLHAFLLWLGVLVLERRLPVIPWQLWVPLLVLTLFGVVQLLNPRAAADPTFAEIVPLEGFRPYLPGTVDAGESRPVLLNLGALALGGLVLRDGLGRVRVRWFLFRTIALSGLVIALVGIYQKASGAEAMLWSEVKPFGNNFFAAYRYHGNAASFLNLSWPAALAVWMRSRLVHPGSIIGSLDLCVLFLVFAAVFVNSSKAGQVIGFLGFLIAAWRFRGELAHSGTTKIGLIVLVFFFTVLGAVFILPGLLAATAKWNEFAQDAGSLTGRLLAYGACLGAVREAGFFGLGAGTFHLVFPYYTLELEDRISGYWYHAHSDWIQTAIEWGWIGFLAWAAIVGGAFVRLWKRCREAARSDRNELSCSVGLLALFLVLVHALGDFPLQIPSIQWLFVFYLALGWSAPHLHQSHHQDHGGLTTGASASSSPPRPLSRGSSPPSR